MQLYILAWMKCARRGLCVPTSSKLRHGLHIVTAWDWKHCS